MNFDKNAVRPILFQPAPFPDVNDRSNNDPMYLISSADVVRIANARRSVEMMLEAGKYPPNSPLLTKADITDEMMEDIVEQAKENGWKGAMVAGKQILLSINERDPYNPRGLGTLITQPLNPGRDLGRHTVLVQFNDKFNLIKLLRRQEKAMFTIVNPVLEGVFANDTEGGPFYINTAGSAYKGFLPTLVGDARTVVLKYMSEGKGAFCIDGELNVVTGDITLKPHDGDNARAYFGALVSFELRAS